MFGESPPEYVHSIVVIFTYILIGGHFAIFPAVFSKVFGNKLGSLLYSISFFGYAISAIIAWVFYYLVVLFTHNRYG